MDRSDLVELELQGEALRGGAGRCWGLGAGGGEGGEGHLEEAARPWCFKEINIQCSKQLHEEATVITPFDRGGN